MSLFDFTEVPENTGDYALLPAGKYAGFVESAEWKTTKAGPEALNLMFRLIDSNRTVFNMYNLFNDSETARNIAMSDLKSLLMASGFNEDALKFETKEDLVEKVLACRCTLKLSVKKSSEWGDKNEIKAYEETREDAVGQSGPQPF